ncbi:hypothetical protein O181_065217 [Austropuccinia psidii MF-1]|uniref:Uncharacterized protein n=1 Tax=Austropuccinia psidii MF-1 TaxID=1389203 RepID=A0A9Q3ET30_9BASI|nr:hypothetical protein [Austropuccinia psidii MF-1]
MKKLYSLDLGTEHVAIASERNKLEPERRELSLEIICINCDVEIAAQFSSEANDDTVLLGDSIDKFNTPKTIQNITT